MPPRSDGLTQFDRFRKEVKKGARYNVLLLAGHEEYLLARARDLYLNAALSAAQREFDFCEFRGADTKARTLWEELTSLPFVAARRVVLLDSPKSAGEDVKTALKQYIARPSETTSLVMVQPLADRRDPLPAWLTKGSETVTLGELRADSRARWAREYVKQRGKVINTDAVSYLIESSSSQLGDLAAKLDGAMLYLGDDSELTVQTLMRTGGISSEFDVFKLQDAILTGKPGEAIGIAQSLLEGGYPLLAMLSMLRGFLIRIWQICAAMRRPGGDEAIENILGRQKFKSQSFKAAARRLGRHRPQRLLVELLELEAHAKSRSSETTLLLFEWLWCISTPESSGTSGTQSQVLAFTG